MLSYNIQTILNIYHLSISVLLFKVIFKRYHKRLYSKIIVFEFSLLLKVSFLMQCLFSYICLGKEVTTKFN